MTLWVVEKYKGSEFMVTTVLKKACLEFKLNYRRVLEESKVSGDFEVMNDRGAWRFRRAELVKRV